MNLNLKDRTALITGGSHGIGRSIALSLAEEGCHIAICSRTLSRLNQTVKEIESLGVKSIAVQADVLKQSDINKVKKTIDQKWRKIDILINNVGGGGKWGKEIFEKTPLKTWKEVYQKNAGATIDFTMWAIPKMRKQKWGRVITIVSILGKEAGGMPWFNMAKAAQISLMKTL